MSFGVKDKSNLFGFDLRQTFVASSGPVSTRSGLAAVVEKKKSCNNNNRNKLDLDLKKKKSNIRNNSAVTKSKQLIFPTNHYFLMSLRNQNPVSILPG